jgi:hypothetical protein
MSEIDRPRVAGAETTDLQLGFYKGFADALAGTARKRSAKECREIGRHMQHLVARLAEATGKADLLADPQALTEPKPEPEP